MILSLSSGELLSLDTSNGLQKILTHLPGSLYQLDCIQTAINWSLRVLVIVQ